MSGPEYTTCVKPEDYTDTGIGSVALGGWWEVCDYMLHRKLVCLGSVRPGKKNGKPKLIHSPDAELVCAIGRIVSFEPPSSKSGFDTIDNDFSFNILLRPDDAIAGLSDNPFGSDAWLKIADGLDAVRRGYQGELLTEQANMPQPREGDDGGPHYGGYTSEMFFDSTRNQSGAAALSLTMDPGPSNRMVVKRSVWYLDGSVQQYDPEAAGSYSVPVLHCECEGTRIHDVFNVADQMPGGGSGCKKHWYTRIGCFLLNLIFLPFTSAFVAEAWANARDGNYHDALEGNGDLNLGDLVLVRGRWAFDAGHHGYNEIHAVHTIQKIPDPADPSARPPRPAAPPAGSPPEAFERFYAAWCGLASEAPPDHAPGERPAGMTPAQTAIYDNQQKPENHFVYHPDVDGCAPAVPVVDRVEPREVNRDDGEQSVVIVGSGFAPGATVAVTGPEVPIKAATVQSSTRIILTLIATSDMPTGARDVVVTNPDNESGSCAGCLVIVQEFVPR